MPNQTNTSRQGRILIVDDDPMMRMLMRESLDESEYDIHEFENGTQALTDIARVPPDMVLLDVKMPGMSGFEVCSVIRREYESHAISIVVVTGLDDADSIERAFDLGATAFISKPINPITFPYRIKYLLSARQTYLSLKQRETHLEYMDRISQTLTRSDSLEGILAETSHEMRLIFEAGSCFIICPDCNETGQPKLVCESVDDIEKPLAGNHIPVVAEYISQICRNAGTNDIGRPVLHRETGENDNTYLLILPLRLDNDILWHLVLKKTATAPPWPDIFLETLQRIGGRLVPILNHYLLMQRLHESEAHLRQAQQIGKLGNWSINLVSGELYWSDEIYNIYGLNRDSYRPSLDNALKHVIDEDRERLKQFEQTAFFSGDTVGIEYRIRTPDGQIRWIYKQGIGKFDDQGNIIAVNGTLQDITERIEKQEKEVHDHKMDAVGQLTSGVAHDFGNLMTIAKGNLELLDEDFVARYGISEDDQDIINDARSAICDGADLTKQLLAFSRKKSIAPEYLDIDDSINRFRHLFNQTLGDTISLEIRIQPHLPDILVDATQFESSLLNAIINAKYAMPNGGKLSIRAERISHLPERIRQHMKHTLTQDYVCIVISDTGDGMDPETLSRSTEPFFTTKKHEGTGLGLSMIYGFMRQSSGALDIESQLDVGTRLLLYFPVFEKNAARTADQGVPLNHIGSMIPEQKTILVVDDRDAVRRFAVRCLQNLSVNILQTDNADDARAIIESNPSIDLLFSDILMPGEMNGRDLANWVTENRPEIKILLTTASERESERTRTDAQIQYTILPKPYNQQDLLTKIHQIIQPHAEAADNPA